MNICSNLLLWKQLHHYLEDLAEPCNEMILRCSFEGHERKCSDLFYAQVGHVYGNEAQRNYEEFQITDEGLCCSFNTMPEPVMFRNDIVKVTTFFPATKSKNHSTTAVLIRCRRIRR